MFRWTNYPFLRIFLAFILGILAKQSAGVSEFIDANFLHVLLSFGVISTGKLLLNQVSNRIWGNLLLITVSLIGYLRAESSSLAHLSKDVQFEWSDSKAYIGTISSFPANKRAFYVYEVDVKTGIRDSSIINVPARVLLYEKKTGNSQLIFNYGDKVKITGSPQPIPSPKNPYEFNFEEYLARQNIFLQQYITSDQIELISKHEGNDFLDRIYQLRSRFEQTIVSQIQEKDEQAIVLALLLGIKGQLDPEIKSAYASAGAMHVLAVSGLHVSIIYFILNWILNLLPSAQLNRTISPAASIGALWVYALLTGFSPSILRAVSMFSIIIFAQILNRKTHVLNSLAFTAFVLLLFKPSFLFAVGFQLSFLAVAGIVYIYPRVYALWTFQSWIGDRIWQLTAVSMAAQLATFPLGLYYFHQFPTYFLFTNLIVIPAAFIIMILGVGLLLFHHWTDRVGWLLEYLVSKLNWFVRSVHKTDGSIIDWVYISPIQVVLIYILIISFISLWQFKNSRYMWMIALTAAGISIDQSLRLLNQSEKEELIFYSMNRGQLIDKVNGFNAQLFSMDSTLNPRKTLSRIKPYRIQNQLPRPEKTNYFNNQIRNFAKAEVLNMNKILFLVKPLRPEQLSASLQADIVVVSNQSLRSLADLRQLIICDQIILDNTNGRIYTEKLKKEADKLGLSLHTLNDQAYRMSTSKK